MRRAMAAAPVGDDVYREDPTINRLQETVAGLLGKEAALFVPSGTMSNQLCLRTLTRPGDEVIVHEDAHVLHYEGGSAAALSGLQLRPLPGALGVLTAEAVERPSGRRPSTSPAPAPWRWRTPTTAAAAPSGRWRRCRRWRRSPARAASAVHLDGARLWNAHKATGVPLEAYAATADSVSVCFSKGLGAPVGSALVGSREFVEEARHNRKRYGGAMRQAGIIAAGALYALEHNLDRLVEDHENAAAAGRTTCGEVPGLEIIHPVQTNILIVGVGGLGVGAERVVAALKERGRALRHGGGRPGAVRHPPGRERRGRARGRRDRGAGAHGAGRAAAGGRGPARGRAAMNRDQALRLGARAGEEREPGQAHAGRRGHHGRAGRALGGDERSGGWPVCCTTWTWKRRPDSMEVHGTRTVEWLREAGLDDEEVLQAILAHNSANGSSVGSSHGPRPLRLRLSHRAGHGGRAHPSGEEAGAGGAQEPAEALQGALVRQGSAGARTS